MKLSEEIINFMVELEKVGISHKDVCEPFDSLNQYLPQIQQLEKEKEQLLEALKEVIKSECDCCIHKPKNICKEKCYTVQVNNKLIKSITGEDIG